MTVKFTPGPWRAEVPSHRGKHCVDVFGSDGRPVTRDLDSWRGPGEAEANALLMAAAPELFEVLRDIVTYVSPGDDVPFATMLDDARAILAKAGDQ